jgi:hypothetical protein
MQDPFASPLVVKLKQQLQQQQQTITAQQNRITQLQIMATQRMERQAEWVASQERIKRFELMFKQWQQENKDTQEARMEVLRRLLDQGDTYGAMAMLQAIQAIDNPVLAEPETQAQMTDATADTIGQYQQGEFNNVGNVTPNVGTQINPGPQPTATANTAGFTAPVSIPRAPVVAQPGRI